MMSPTSYFDHLLRVARTRVAPWIGGVRPVMRRTLAISARVTIVAPLLLFASACGDLARLVTPGVRGPSGPAMIAFTANVPRTVATAADVVTLNVTASYVRQDGTRVRIGAQLLTLTTETLQSVPIPVDVATCIADPLRDTGGATGTASCAVVLELALQVNSVVVDQQLVGPLRLSPGTTSTVAQPVTLIDLASVELLQGTGATIGASDVVPLFLGSSMTFSAKVRDTRGQLVTDRPVTWSSDDPTIASVDRSSGAITSVALGTTKITAHIGMLAASASLKVLRAPAALTIAIGSGTGTGTVRSSPSGIDCRVVGTALTGTCSFMFPGDAAVSLTSTAETGSVFASWGDACVASSIGVSCQVVMSQARVATVNFAALRRVTVSGAAGSDGRGRVTSPSGIDCRIASGATTGTCAVDVVQGTVVQLSASGEPGANNAATQQFFAGWGGDCAATTAATCAVTVGANGVSASARFVDVQALSVSIDGNGGGSVTSAGIACVRALATTSGSCATTSVFGSSVTLTATPDAQSSFVGWGGACSGSALTCTVALSQARVVTASFTRRQVQLILTLGGAGAGSMQATGGLNCSLVLGQGSNSCSKSYDAGTSVTITWSAGASSDFTGFGGACSGNTTCTLILSSSQGVSGSFGARQVTLTLLTGGAGFGTISASNGLSCASSAAQPSASCSVTTEIGATISVSATPADGSSFDTFGGDCSGRTSCTVTMISSRTVSATFARKRAQVTVLLGGTGGGVVTGNGTAVCALGLGQGSGSCIAQVDAGTVLNLTATPGVESNFVGFSGGNCVGNPCSITVVSDATINANFQRKQFTLQLTASGTGAGTVSTDGVVCTLAIGQNSNVCARLVDYGATVNIATTVLAGSSFDGYSGACTGLGSCAIVMTAPATVTASITRRQVPLTLTLTGTGGGTIGAGVGGTCTLSVDQGSTTCTRLVELGATLTITASALDNSVFQGFGGNCTSTSAATFATCTLIMDAPKSVSGGFTKRDAPILGTPGAATISKP